MSKVRWVGRHASPILGGLKLGKVVFLEGCQIVVFRVRLCKLSNIFGGLGVILGVIQFLYLSNKMSLIIRRNASKAF